MEAIAAIAIVPQCVDQSFWWTFRSFMAASPKLWYVQTDFGALLGPMPEDALFEMARTGALLGRDQVREESDGTWNSASDWPGLFEEADLSSFDPPVVVPEIRSPRPAMTATETAVEEMDDLDFETDVRVIAPPKISEPPLVVDKIEVADVSFATQPMITAEPELKPAMAPVPSSPPAISHEPESTTDTAPTWKASSPVAALLRRPAALAAFLPRPSRGPQRWLVVSIAAATVSLMMLATWWLWPRQRFDLYTDYVAIHKEWQQRREKTQDQAGWNEFVARAKAQLNESVPDLEQTAIPGQRDKSLLLYVGRDLQEILNQPPGFEGSHQERLDYFVEQLQEIYARPAD